MYGGVPPLAVIIAEYVPPAIAFGNTPGEVMCRPNTGSVNVRETVSTPSVTDKFIQK